MDEATLVAAAQAGKLAAFNELVVRFQDLAFGVAQRMLMDADEAADVVQDSFISAYENLKRLRGDSFKAWLLRIVVNRCYDRLRARQRHPSDHLDDLVERGAEPRLEHDQPASPEQMALRAELRATIERGLATLPPDQRAAVILYDVQGFSYEEAALAMDTSLGTMKSRLSRGRAKLRDFLLANGELSPGSIRPEDGAQR
ncbi:MAG: sigma-70 family RNA polymerase sigma factor [Chloroflexi bacterium]|nr:sigma-70 family RNA polymerase sigma factor [Chloroflexota bacterium]